MSRIIYLTKVIGQVSYFILVKGAEINFDQPKQIDVPINNPFN